jgi:hypothetical protein
LCWRCALTLTPQAPQIRLMRNPETGAGKGFAFVRYQSAAAAAVRDALSWHSPRCVPMRRVAAALLRLCRAAVRFARCALLCFVI